MLENLPKCCKIALYVIDITILLCYIPVFAELLLRQTLMK